MKHRSVSSFAARFAARFAALLAAPLAALLAVLLLFNGCAFLSENILTVLEKTSDDERSSVSVYVNGELAATVGHSEGKVTLPELAKLPGYELDAWYADKACTVPYDGGENAYAQYLPIS